MFPMPISPYGVAKLASESYCQVFHQVYGLETVALRYFNVFGPRQSLSNPYTGVIAIFLSRLLAGQRPLVYEDGAQTRDFVSVHDVVSAILTAIDSPAANGQVVNIGSGIGRGIASVAATLARVIGRDDLLPEITCRFRSGDIRHCTADIARARDLLGFEPTTSWEAGLKEVADWARTAPSADRVWHADRELQTRGLVSDRRGATA